MQQQLNKHLSSLLPTYVKSKHIHTDDQAKRGCTNNKHKREKTKKKKKDDSRRKGARGRNLKYGVRRF